jgi:hypothetical protein
MADDFFAPPAFKPDDALVQLRRSLRELRGLAERGSGFDWKGQPVIALAVDGDAIAARLAKRPARSPDWETRRIASSVEQRKWLDEVRARVKRWSDADE